MRIYDRSIAHQIEYIKNGIKSDPKFWLIHNTRNRIHQALKGKTKPSSTINILRIETDTYPKRMEYQMNPDIKWSKNEIDEVKPICLFDVSN